MRTTSSTAALVLGIAACMCNLIVVLLPIGILLGIAALVVALAGSSRSRGTIGAALALSGVSFLIAAVWALTAAAIFWIDPTLLA